MGVRMGAGVKVWAGGAVGDESGEAEFVPKQAERMIDMIPKIPINFILYIGLTLVGFPILMSNISRDRGDNLDQGRKSHLNLRVMILCLFNGLCDKLLQNFCVHVCQFFDVEAAFSG